MDERGSVDPADRDARGGPETSRRRRVSFPAVLNAGGRDPVVVILSLAGFFDGISGNPIHGLVLGTAAAILAFDEAAGLADARSWPGLSATTTLGESTAVSGRAVLPVVGVISGPLTWPIRLLVSIAAVVTADVVGGFGRYSWPATTAIVAIGAVVVVIAWRGPLHRDVVIADGGSALPWAVVFIALGLWELVALLMQPTLTTDSWAHPTLSTLMDPVLATHPGRAISIAVWLLVGGFLIRR
jgi:hypothetical protein